MFKYQKKMHRDDDEDKMKKKRKMDIAGSGSKSVFDESRSSGSMYGNHRGGSAYPTNPPERFYKGSPSKIPGSYMGEKPFNESIESGSSYGNHRPMKSSASSDMDEPDMRGKKRRKEMAVAMLSQKMKKRY